MRRGPLWPRDSVPERERSSVATEFAKKLRELSETRSESEYIFVIERLKTRCTLDGGGWYGTWMRDRGGTGGSGTTYDGKVDDEIGDHPEEGEEPRLDRHCNKRVVRVVERRSELREC